MPKNSKKYEEAVSKVDRTKFYSIDEAAPLAKEIANKKFDESVEVALKVNADPKKSDQNIRGTVVLPSGSGKTSKVIVFTQGANVEIAKKAGADEVGADELIDKVAKGWTDFDVAIATPDLMGKIGKIARVLGPRGLMPNPKTGTVTLDVANAINEIKAGKIEFKIDRQANIHVVIGKVSFEPSAIEANFNAVVDEINRQKPASVKGKLIQKATLSTSMGPGIHLDTSNF